MTRHFFLPGWKDLPQENTQWADPPGDVAAAATDAEAGVAARIAAGVAASTPPAMRAIGVMIARKRCRIGLPPRWMTRKTRSSRENEQYFALLGKLALYGQILPLRAFRLFSGATEPAV
jgi:hypothetical protein